MKNKILKQTINVTVEVKDNIVYKTFNRGIPLALSKEWEKDYNDLSDINSHFVKIIEYNRAKNYISMPYMLVEEIDKFNFQKKHLCQTLQLIKDIMIFAEERNGFLHTDLSSNLMFNAETGNIIVLDPDSFCYRFDPNTTIERSYKWYYRSRREFDIILNKQFGYWYKSFSNYDKVLDFYG